MEKTELFKYIINPASLSQESLTKVSDLANSYPYFQTAHLLAVKNLQNVSSTEFTSFLRRTATYVTDRKILYYLLHSKESINPYTTETENISGQEVERKIKDTLKDNISDILKSQLEIMSKPNSRDVELIHDIAFDIRKEYGEGIELDDDFPFKENPEIFLLEEKAKQENTEIENENIEKNEAPSDIKEDDLLEFDSSDLNELQPENDISIIKSDPVQEDALNELTTIEDTKFELIDSQTDDQDQKEETLNEYAEPDKDVE